MPESQPTSSPALLLAQRIRKFREEQNEVFRTGESGQLLLEAASMIESLDKNISSQSASLREIGTKLNRLGVAAVADANTQRGTAIGTLAKELFPEQFQTPRSDAGDRKNS